MLFIYDSTQHSYALDMEKALAKRCPGLFTHGVNELNVRSDVRMLTRQKKLIVPTDLDHCTPSVERLRTVALACNIEVVNLTAFLNKAIHQPNRPVAAAAVPPAQQLVVAGQNP